MKLTTRKKAAAWAKTSKSRMISSSSLKAQMQELKKDARDLDVNIYHGWIYAVNGFEATTTVHFYLPDILTSYISTWPAWAYELALQSFLTGKKLMVVSDGIPMGENLIQVTILQQDID